MCAAQVIAVRVSEGLTAHARPNGTRLEFDVCLRRAY